VTISDIRSAFASAGGHARSKVLSATRRAEIAAAAGRASAAARKKKQKELASKLERE